MTNITSQIGSRIGLLRLIRLTPFETSTAEGRARERLRRAALTSGTAAFARLVMMATPLISIPLMLRYLGAERYGMWMTISSTIALLAYADLGVGNGLVSKIAEAQGRNDRDAAARFASSAFVLLSGIALVVLLILAAVYSSIPWWRLFNVGSAAAVADAGPVMAIYVICFAVSLPLAIVQKIQAGSQEGFQSNLWQCANSLLALGGVIAVIRWRGSLPLLVAAMVGTQVLVLLANCAYFYGRSRPWLRPRLSHFDAGHARGLLQVGVGFFLTSSLAAFGMYSDNLIASQTLGAGGVTQLGVPARMAAFLTAIPQMLYLPFWSANAEAFARGESEWVRQNLRRTIRVSLLLTCLAAVAFVVAGPVFIHWWTGRAVAAPIPLMMALALAAIAVSVAGPGFMVLNAAGVVYPQVMIYGMFSVGCIAFKIWWAGKWGAAGIAWATAVCYPLLVLAPLWYLVARVLGRTHPRPVETRTPASVLPAEAGL